MKNLKQYLEKYRYSYIIDGFADSYEFTPNDSGAVIEFIKVGYQNNDEAVKKFVDENGYRLATIAEVFEYFDTRKVKDLQATIEGDYYASFRILGDEQRVRISKNVQSWSKIWTFAVVRK